MTPDFQTRLQQSLGAAYVLERELAGGGMSRVFVAMDTALGRRIVIKVLPPDLAPGVSAERFTREVLVAARLQHPHIVPVHATGVAANLPYYTMPFVEGDTLRARIARGPVPVEDAVRILRDVARALEYAHGKGVVHRDIKPDNIFLAGTSAVVSDFGIAKAITAARTETPSGAADSITQLTQAGTAVGTPAYMSPEQAAGAPDVDHRADIYSFGCVAYEVLSGSPPFTGEAHRLILAHIAQRPAPLSNAATAAPDQLVSLVMHCLEKSPDERPQTAGELLTAMETVTTPGAMPVASARHRMLLKGAVGIGALAAVAWFSALVLGDRHVASTGVEGAPSLAIIPFVNIGGDTATEYFADGITDELATALGRVSQLRIAARSSAYRYKGRRDLDTREVGRALDVDLVLTGSARRAAQEIRVSAQLSSAADGVEIWSQTFDRPFDDVLALTDSLTADISGAISGRLGAGAAATSAVPVRPQAGTSSPSAYDAYLRGKYALIRRRPGLEDAARDFSEAIARDPRFARAFAGFSTALALLTYFGDSQPTDRVKRAREAALTALRLDSTNAEAHVALGILALTQHHWGEAEQSLERAIALAPRLADAHFHLGRALLYQGRLEDADRSFAQALGLEPFSPVFSVWLGRTRAWLGDGEQALAEMRRAWDLDSNSALVQNAGALAFLEQGETEMAQRIARLAGQSATLRGTFGYVLARTGDREGALLLLQTILDRDGLAWLDQFNLSLLYLGLGDTTRALDAMHLGADRGEPIAAFHPLSGPIYDPVRASSRFAALVRRAGLDPMILTAPRAGRVP